MFLSRCRSRCLFSACRGIRRETTLACIFYLFAEIMKQTDCQQKAVHVISRNDDDDGISWQLKDHVVCLCVEEETSPPASHMSLVSH